MNFRKFQYTSKKNEKHKHRWEWIVEISIYLRKHDVPKKVVKGIIWLVRIFYKLVDLIEKLLDIFEKMSKLF